MKAVTACAPAGIAWMCSVVACRRSEGRTPPEGLATLSLSCLDDDAQGEAVAVAWAAEIEAQALAVDDLATLAQHGTDDPAMFSADLRTLRWSTATAADRDLLQAPFRAGIRLDACQLPPPRRAPRLARVSLLIADDVDLGKTVEAGLILREMLPRRRLDFTLVVAPALMCLATQSESPRTRSRKPSKNRLSHPPTQ